MTRFIKCPVLVLLLMHIPHASAQSSASISGTVTDQREAVVAGAAVRILNIAGGRTLIVETNSSGRYHADGLLPGSYQISVSSEGFANIARTVMLRGSDSAVHDFTLVPGAINDAITITASKGSPRLALDTPQTVTVANTIRIEKQRPLSPTDLIERTPSLTEIGSNPAGGRPRLRGLSSNRLLLVIDGERLNNVRSDPISGISTGVVDVTQLQAVEVVSGAGSSLFGSDALAGTINLITNVPVRADAGHRLGIRFDGDLHTNGLFRRGGVAINWSVPTVALRLSQSLFRNESYHSGNEAIRLEEVLRLGRFATDLGNAVGNNVARTYTVWSLPAGAEIPNGRGHGFNDQLDLWIFPSTDHNLRYRQLNSQHKDIGFPFIIPPYDGRNQFNGFRRLDKYGLRYEARDLTGWLPHLAASFYRQKYSFADDNFVSTVNAGSSWAVTADSNSPTGSLPVLTGNPSTFTPGNFTDGKNSVTSYGSDVQATLTAFAGAVITTGIGYLRDFSKDEFSRIDFKQGSTEPTAVISGKASNPDSVYKNLGWYNIFEYEPARWMRLVTGFRLDNWKTSARPTPGFPLGTESIILQASFDRLIASPGGINVEGLNGISDLVSGKRGISTDNTIFTGNLGVVLRLPGRINPYFRWATSYREPGITERYILRDFGDPTFSVLLVSNTALKPERGKNYDVGVKAQHDKWNASFGYFRNNLEDFLRPSFANAIFIPADPARGLLPVSPEFPFHGVLYVQRTNTARARIQGFEAVYEVNVPLQKLGSLAPFGTMSWLKGSDLTPDANTLALISQFYNRPDTPIQLQGSANDSPLTGITPFRGIFGASYADPGGNWFGEYEVRYQSRVKRADPMDLSSTILTQYGILASFNSFARQSLHAGYNHRRESYRVSFTFGIENLTDRLYFEHFQNAPAPGRSFVFGVTMDFSNLLSR